MAVRKKKTSKKKVAKKTTKKKTTKKKASSGLFDAESILDDLKEFDVSVMSSEKEDTVPYLLDYKNKALQVITGGMIGGRFIEISGDSQTGKSFLAYEIIADCIAKGGTALLNDLEKAFEPSFGKKVGMVAGQNFLYSKVSDIHKFFQMARKFTKAVRRKKRTRVPLVIVADSYAGFKTKVDLENEEANKDPRGYMAMQKNAAFSQSLDSFCLQYLDKYDVTFILINQTRKDNSVQYGDDTYTLGEQVIKFWCTQRLQGKLRRKIKKKVGTLRSKEKKKTIGVEVEWTTIKNRRVEPHQSATVQVVYSKGLLPYSGLAEVLANNGLIKAEKPRIEKVGRKQIKHKRFKVIESGEVFESIKELVGKHPEFLEPRLTANLPEPTEDELEVEEEEIK